MRRLFVVHIRNLCCNVSVHVPQRLKHLTGHQIVHIYNLWSTISNHVAQWLAKRLSLVIRMLQAVHICNLWWLVIFRCHIEIDIKTSLKQTRMRWRLDMLSLDFHQWGKSRIIDAHVLWVKSKYKKVGVLPMRIAWSNVWSIGPPSERNTLRLFLCCRLRLLSSNFQFKFLSETTMKNGLRFKIRYEYV